MTEKLDLKSTYTNTFVSLNQVLTIPDFLYHKIQTLLAWLIFYICENDSRKHGPLTQECKMK